MDDETSLPFPGSDDDHPDAPDLDDPPAIDSDWDYEQENDPPVLGNVVDAMDIDPRPDNASTTSNTTASNSTIPAAMDVDLDPWRGFDEFQDRDEPLSIDEMIQRLDDMVGPEEEAEMWDASKPYSMYFANCTSLNLIVREFESNRQGPR